MNPLLQIAANDERRNAHWVKNPVTQLYEPTLLLEGQRTNLAINSAFGLGTTDGWITSGPVSTIQEGILSNYALDLIGPEGSASYIQNTCMLSPGTYIMTIWYEVLEGQAPYLWTTGYEGSIVGGSYQFTTDTSLQTLEIELNVTDNTYPPRIRYASITPQDNTEGVFRCYGIQVEQAPFPSSYIPTFGSPVTRAADNLTIPFHAPPQEMTIYGRVYQEFPDANNAQAVIATIGSQSTSSPKILIYAPWGHPRVYFHNGNTAATALSSGTVVNEVILLEHLTTINNSEIIFGRTFNGGDFIQGAPVTNPGLPTQWLNPVIRLSAHGAQANTCYTHFHVEPGVHDLETMRQLAEVDRTPRFTAPPSITPGQGFQIQPA